MDPMTRNDRKKSNFFGKVLAFPLCRIIIAVIFVNIPTFILRSLAQLIMTSLSIENDALKSLVVFIVRMLSVYFAYAVFTRLLERRKAEEMSLDPSAFKEFAVGAFLGLFLISIVLTLLWAMGHFQITGTNASAPLAQSFLFFFFNAFLQDIVYFAIIFRISEKSLGSWIAIAIASMIFGFKHLLFPEYTLWSIIAQTIEAGVLFSALFILSRRIWLIFGFHFVWNFVQYGFILGFESEKLTSLFTTNFSGSSLITGMPVGPEASLVTFCLFTALGIFILIRASKKHRFLMPRWKREKASNRRHECARNGTEGI